MWTYLFGGPPAHYSRHHQNPSCVAGDMLPTEALALASLSLRPESLSFCSLLNLVTNKLCFNEAGKFLASWTVARPPQCFLCWGHGPISPSPPSRGRAVVLYVPGVHKPESEPTAARSPQSRTVTRAGQLQGGPLCSTSTLHSDGLALVSWRSAALG